MHRFLLAAAFCFWISLPVVAQFPPSFEDIPEQLGPNSWRLTWRSEIDRIYRLERSVDLQNWSEVDTVTATSAFTSLDDNNLGNEELAFWRVVELPDEPGDPLTVGDLTIVGMTVDQGLSTLDLSLSVRGTEQVSEVIIRDGPNLLGNAFPGFDETWSFQLPWDANTPTVRNLMAEVRTREGSVAQTSPVNFLLADPAKFIPLSADGRPLYGQVLPLDPTGLLGPFLYYPEGLGGAATATGAHFEFATGARAILNSPVKIVFSEGKFFRGPADNSPAEVSGGLQRELPLDHLEPPAIAAAYDLPSESITLQWGDSEVSWQSGSLGSNGWSNLQIDLSLGDFLLPGDRFNATVTQDPESGVQHLVVCYSGTWTPLPNGPILSIPQADPLKIYLSSRGEFAAHGTAEATFPDGAAVRGTVSWRDPNFEFRFAGKGIVIGGLNSLRSVLPANPEDCLPVAAEPSASELDALTECLEGYQSLFRGLATGAVSQSGPAAPASFTPLPSPTDQAGSVLEAWAGRIASWQGDRDNQSLTTEQTAELTKVITQAAKSAESAHDLSTALKFLRDLAKLTNHLGPALDADPATESLLAAVAEAELRVLAATRRTAAEWTTPSGDEELAEVTSHLLAIRDEIKTVPAPAPRKTERVGSPRKALGPQLEQEIDKIVSGVTDRFDLDTFTRRGIKRDDLTGEDNTILATMSQAELLQFLEELVNIVEFLRSDDPEVDAATAPEALLLLESTTQLEFHLSAGHNATTARAVQRRDTRLLLGALQERARIFRGFHTLGISLASDFAGFDLSTSELLAQAEPRIIDLILNILPSERIDLFQDFATAVQKIANTANDAALEPQLSTTRQRIKDFNDLLRRDAAALLLCDGLARDLRARGHAVSRLPLGQEGSQEPPLTGKYESDPAEGAPFWTLQINQGGRYFQGYLQFHNQGSPMTRFLLLGMLSDEQPDQATYSFLRLDPTSRRIISSGDLEARRAGQLTSLTLRERNGLSADFVQTTNFPAYSESLVNLFSGETRAVLEANERSPLHSVEAEAMVLAAIDPGEPKDAPPANPPANLKDFVQLYLTAAPLPADRTALAVAINDFVQALQDALPSEHLPLLRTGLRLILTRDFLTIDDLTRSYWERLMIIFNEQRAIMPDFARLLGISPSEISSAQNFTYTFTLTQTGASAVVAGAIKLVLVVEKTSPTGQTTTFAYDGALGQIGIGLGANLTTSPDVVGPFELPYNYTKEDLEGDIIVTGVSAGIAAFGGFTIGVNPVFVIGNGLRPPVVFDTGLFSKVEGFQLSVGFDYAGGKLVARDEINTPVDIAALGQELVTFTGQSAAESAAAAEFEVNGSIINACGWQRFREFVAEYRALFASETAQVTIVASTDTTGTDAFNDGLSQRRADAAKAAVLTILGDLVAIPEDKIQTLALGEAAARSDMPLPTFPGAQQKFVRLLRDSSAPIDDNTDDPEWRRVVVFVNDLVSFEIKSPPVAKP